MKHVVKPLSASIAATVMVAASFAPVANAELSANLSVASMYLWRGVDLGDGSPAVQGGLQYDLDGAYAGVWGSSGDNTLGNEYDLYAGYGGEVGGFRYDLSLWNYNYSDFTMSGNAAANNNQDDTTGELTEVILGLGYGPVSFQYYDNVAGASGYEYYTLSATYGQFAAKVGFHDAQDGGDMTHLDLTYAYNDNLSFTLSKVVDQQLDEKDPDAFDEDMKFVVSYSFPL